MRIALVGILALKAACALGANDPTESLSARQNAHQAAEAFRSGDYAGAVEIYKKIEDNHIINGDLLYNLGNAYYRAGKFSHALAAYKGAQRFLPRDGDLAANLDYARKQRIDALEEKPNYPRLVFFWLTWGALGEFLILSGTTLGLFFASLMACRLFWKESPLWPRMILGILAAFCTLSFAGKRAGLVDSDEAVVGVPEVAVKSGDREGDITLFVIHEGTEVTLGTRRSPWVQIALIDGKKGWIRADSLILVSSEASTP